MAKNRAGFHLPHVSQSAMASGGQPFDTGRGVCPSLFCGEAVVVGGEGLVLRTDGMCEAEVFGAGFADAAAPLLPRPPFGPILALGT
jgi:hypothetical protein